VRGLAGYWGPSEGLVLGLRRGQAQTHIRLKNGTYSDKHFILVLRKREEYTRQMTFYFSITKNMLANLLVIYIYIIKCVRVIILY